MEQLRRTLPLIVAMIAHHRLADAVVIEEDLCLACVLSRDEVDRGEHLDRAVRNILEVAYGSGNEI